VPENTTSIIDTDIIKNPNTTLPTVDPVVTKTEEKAPLIQKIEDQVVDSLILKVEKESKILQEIAKPIVDKKEVKDSSVKVEAPKEIVPTVVKPIQ
jgi:hypothetical protein